MASGDDKPKTFWSRAEKAAGDLNAVLFVIALGLAALDASCYWAFKLRDIMPPAQTAALVGTPAAPVP